jgi:hypothetical protein
MTGFLLDTNVPSELTRVHSNPHVEKWLNSADDEQLFLSVISLGEILKGLTLLPQSKRREELRSWIDLKAIQELLGHSTMEMTMRYAHLSPGVRRDEVRLLDGPIPTAPPIVQDTMGHGRAKSGRKCCRIQWRRRELKQIHASAKSRPSINQARPAPSKIRPMSQIVQLSARSRVAL